MIAIDKQAHFLGGISLADLAMPFGIWYAIAAPIIGGAAKEAYDSTGRGNVELADFAYTVAGGAAYLGWILLLK